MVPLLDHLHLLYGTLLTGQWGPLPTHTCRLCRSGGHTVAQRSRGRIIGSHERDVHRHCATCLHEDPATVGELCPLDASERHLEERVTVVGVRLERNTLAWRLPFAEDAGPASKIGSASCREKVTRYGRPA